MCGSNYSAKWVVGNSKEGRISCRQRQGMSGEDRWMARGLE